MLKKAIRAALKPFGIIVSRSPYILNTTFLLEKVRGHALSEQMQESVDYDGSPLPWLTYPAIEYLASLDLREKKVFEWGCGNGSRWFAGRAKTVVSVERSKEWAEKIAAYQLPNLEIVVEPDIPKTAEVIARRPEAPFDVIVIDDEQRDRCCEIAPRYLSENGLIILDNSERHPAATQHLRSQNFIQVDFYGFAPIISFTSVTSFFFSRMFDFQPLNQRMPGEPIGSHACERYLSLSKDFR